MSRDCTAAPTSPEVVGLKKENKMIVLGRYVTRSMREFLRPEVAAWFVTSAVAILAALATSMLLGGCASSGIEPHAMSLPVDQVASAKTLAPVGETGSWPSEDWWQRYGDAQLNGLVDEALLGSPSLRLAQARLGRAQALAQVAESSHYPTVSLDGSSQRGKFTANYIYPPPLGGQTFTTNQLGLNFNWDLDFWGKNSSAINAAQSSVHASEADTAAARLALTTSVTRAWFQLQRLYALRDVTEASIKQRTDILELTRQRVSAGLDTNVELRQAESELPQARVDLEQLDESIALTRNQLAALMGRGPDRAIEFGRPAAVVGDVISLPPSLPLELISRRPDIVAARWRVESSRSTIDNAKAQFYPNINLVAAAGFLALGNFSLLSQGSENTLLGPAFSLPLFKGSLRGNLRVADADYDAAVEQYNQTVIDAVHDVADQITSLQSLQRQQREQQQALATIEQAYALAVLRYKAGLGNYLIVLTAESAVLQQRRASAELKARTRELNVNLVRALGGGFRDSSAAIANR
jgi:NodT family efflux transporter outer membrane factor (OMF) lipoprotein